MLYQDSTSTIQLERNGKASSRQRTKHINIEYFFIKDRVESGEITIIYCPTEDMIADFFTKPLQGIKFIQFRESIMGFRKQWNKSSESRDKLRSVLVDPY